MPRYNIKLFIVNFLCLSYSYALSNLEGEEHMELFIHQDIINNFLHSIGEIKGKGKMTIIGYNWTVSNANIVIDEGEKDIKIRPNISGTEVVLYGVMPSGKKDLIIEVVGPARNITL